VYGAAVGALLCSALHSAAVHPLTCPIHGPVGRPRSTGRSSPARAVRRSCTRAHSFAAASAANPAGRTLIPSPRSARFATLPCPFSNPGHRRCRELGRCCRRLLHPCRPGAHQRVPALNSCALPRCDASGPVPTQPSCTASSWRRRGRERERKLRVCAASGCAHATWASRAMSAVMIFASRHASMIDLTRCALLSGVHAEVCSTAHPTALAPDPHCTAVRKRRLGEDHTKASHGARTGGRQAPLPSFSLASNPFLLASRPPYRRRPDSQTGLQAALG
jgi:hypothetical protein